MAPREVTKLGTGATCSAMMVGEAGYKNESTRQDQSINRRLLEFCSLSIVRAADKTLPDERVNPYKRKEPPEHAKLAGNSY